MVQPISKSIFNQKKPENLIHKTLNNISDGTIKLQQSPTKKLSISQLTAKNMQMY